MPTPKAGYRLKDGTQVPGTTTICGAYKDSGGLIHWAWNQGKLGLDYRETRDKAGDIGTIIHAAIEARLSGAPFPLLPEEGQKSFDGFLRWEDRNEITILEQEIQLVSEEYRFGGTLDAVGRDREGNYVLLDWKTSKGVYKNYLLQLAAYAELWNENCPGREITAGAWLVRFSKSDGICEPYPFPMKDLVVPLEQFLDLRRCYGREYLLDEILKRAKSCMKPL